MPVFDWEENGAPVIQPGFKYYCIATVASTVFVLVLWALAMAFGSRSRAAKKESKGSGTRASNV
jgi:hypothetical protein